MNKINESDKLNIAIKELEKQRSNFLQYMLYNTRNEKLGYAVYDDIIEFLKENKKKLNEK